MSGRRINRTQVAKYMEHRKRLEQEAVAAKVGISVRSARRIASEIGELTRQKHVSAPPMSILGMADQK
jgi:acyl-CoA synthetase (NDP forming)